MLFVSNWKHILKHKKHKIAKYSKQHFTATISDQEMYPKKQLSTWKSNSLKTLP